MLPQNINVRVVNIVCERRQKKKRRDTESHDEPLRATEKPLQTTFRKKKKTDPLSAFRHWPRPGQETAT